MASMQDVARAAGVSVATVSRTLSGSDSVTPRTQDRVWDAVRRLDYRPDEVARSMRRRQSTLVGLMVSTIENRFFTEVAHAAEQSAHAHGLNLVVCNTNEDPEQERNYLRVLDQQLVAGVILAPAPGTEAHLAEYVHRNLPMVLVNRRLDNVPMQSITSNDEEAAQECVEFLIGEGKQSIAAIMGLPTTFTTQQRLSGYRRALQTAGFPHSHDNEIDGLATLEGGYIAAKRLLSRSSPPDGLFVFNNLMVQGAIIAVQELGLRWPEQIDIAGFGATAVGRLCYPRLTLVKQPTREMGHKAIELLIAQMRGEPQPPQHHVLKNRLVHRDDWSRI